MAPRAGIQNTSGESRWTPIKQEAEWKGGYRQVGGRRGRKWADLLPPGSYFILEGGWLHLLRSKMEGNTLRV